jgi:hypothetical protein
MRYIIKDYCKKYPNDPGDQNIHDDDNKKWGDTRETDFWRLEANRLSCVGLLTYGNCGSCWSSGHAYKSCITCVCDEYRVVESHRHVLDSQTISEKLSTNHEISKANRKQNWTRTVGARFNTDTIRLVHERKPKNIEDAEGRGGIVQQDIYQFLDEYKEVTHS